MFNQITTHNQFINRDELTFETIFTEKMKLGVSLSGLLVASSQRCDNVGADEVRCDPVGCPPDEGGLGCNAGGQVNLLLVLLLTIEGYAMSLLW